MVVKYHLPRDWIRYDIIAISEELINAKAAVLSLTSIPYQRAWAEKLQEIELKREVAGTSRIEGAEFTEREFEEALTTDVSETDLTRSQRQARAAINTYNWISKQPPDRPISEDLIREVHRRVVTGCDDDHCQPGQLRGDGENVIFGRPRHRGAEGGRECSTAFASLVAAFNNEYREHDPLIRAFAFHYHFGAMHPFQDGNGRTARALEALILQRAGLRDTLFIAMSNYYYDEKATYLDKLSEVMNNDFDLTPFLKFALKGLAHQCQRLLKEITTYVQKSLFRDVINRMYGRLRSTRKRALAGRQVEILNKLLDRDDAIEYLDLYDYIQGQYSKLQTPVKAYVRDLNQLARLKAISVRQEGQTHGAKYLISVRLEWATQITETDFYKEIDTLPSAKTKLMVSEN